MLRKTVVLRATLGAVGSSAAVTPIRNQRPPRSRFRSKPNVSMRKRLPIVKGDESGFTIAYMILGLVLSVCVVTLLLVVLIPRIGDGGNDQAGAKSANTGTSSPDSSSASRGSGHIFFGWDRYPNGMLDASVWRINPDGSGPLKIASDASNPVVSPDGQRIAFMRYEGNSDYTLWVASSDGTGQKKLFDPDDWSLESPTLCEWSPDGSILISGSVQGESSFYHISESGSLKKTAFGGTYDYSSCVLRVAPDGRLLYGNVGASVYIQAPGAPSDSRVFVTARGYSAVWTPDGRFVVAISSEGDDALLVYQAPPGGAAKLVRKIKMTLPPRCCETAQPAIENLSVSPDGRWIVFDGADCMVEREVAWPCPNSLWVVGIDGKGLRKLTAGYSPNWGR